MRRQFVLESAVTARIRADLRLVPGLVVRKRIGTAMGLAGDPDLYGTYRGRHFEMEVKRPNDPRAIPTKLQAQRMDEWRAGGAIVGVVHSPAEARLLLGIDHTPRSLFAWTCAACRKSGFRSADPPERCLLCGGRKFEQDTAPAL